MCNSVLRVKRRLLTLLLIVGCMAISAPAFARVCFLPDSKDCGIPGIKDIPETCDGINTFTDVDDCKNNIADGQKCEPINEGGCYAATCEYADKAACEADVDEYCTDNNYYFCEYDSSIGCYVLNKQECSYNTENKCTGYTLDQEEDGKTCCACTRTTCKKCGQTKDVTKYKCIETKYQEVGCDDFDKTKAEADTLKAQNYTCTSCTREKQKQTCDGSWDKFSDGTTVYKCTKCTETKDCSDYTYTTLSDTTNATSCNNGCGETKWKCKDGYTYDETSKSCKKGCNITIACNMKPLGERSDIDNTTKGMSIDIRYSCTISNYDDVKSYLDKLNLVIKTKLACVQGDSNIVKSGQYYEMTKIPFSKATSSTFSGTYELYNPLYKDKLDCGSNHTSYEETTYELDNQTGCTLSTTTKKNTCASWNLKTETEANCGAGEIFEQDTTHKTDDNGDKCGTCVKKNHDGFTIQYATGLNRNWTCGGSFYSYSAYLMKVKFNSKTYKYEALGSTTYDVYDEASAYTAGTYFVCITGGTPSAPTVSVDRILIKGTRGQVGEPYTAMCFSNNAHTYNGTECVKATEIHTNVICKEFMFEKGKQYYIDMRFSSSFSDGVKCYQ